ncbi:MAG: hypothetical protein ACI4V7_10370 [Succinivibrionaceae bacterium]
MNFQNSKSGIAEVEFNQLVNEVSKYNFITSSQVSRYIRENRLGFKYRHISGRLEMKKGRDVWNFEGGISPKYFGRLCKELNLDNNHSLARVNKFTPYASLLF